MNVLNRIVKNLAGKLRKFAGKKVIKPSKDARDNFSSCSRIPVFSVGTGRCGTHFLQKLMEYDPSIVSYHMPFLELDSFFRYCHWNNIQVDIEPFFAAHQGLIDQALEEGRIYFEANPYLDWCIIDFFRRFRAKFIFLARNPKDVVNSHFVKGWYKNKLIRSRIDVPVGFQPDMRVNHFFGRIVPNGEEYIRWDKLTRIGKISWMWNRVNQTIIDQLKEIPHGNSISMKIEDLSYENYLKLHAFTGGITPVSEKRFEQIRKERPGKGRGYKSPDSWSKKELEEFERETTFARKYFVY